MKDPAVVAKQTEHLVKAYEAIGAKMLALIGNDDGTDVTVSEEWKRFVAEASRTYIRSLKLQAFIKQVIEEHVQEIVSSVVAEDIEKLSAEVIERTKQTLQSSFEEKVKQAIESEMKKGVEKVKAQLFK